MKRLLILLLLVAACAGTGPDGNPASITYSEFTTPDGRVIPCLTYNTGYAGGISCDWNPR